MKRSIFVILGVVTIFLMGACSKRVLLSDEELAQIFHDAFLANAYTSHTNLKLDSLRLYDPIFEKYGCTAEDVQYTIGNFSKRKSARLGDVVERAIAMLEEEGKRLDLEVAILDTVDNIVTRRATREIYRDSIIELRSKRDSSKLQIAVDVGTGDYEIDFDYLVDSLDGNKASYSTRYWLEKDDSLRTKFQTNVHMLRKNSADHYNRKFSVSDKNTRLVLSLAQIDDEKINHHVTFKNLSIKRTPRIEDAQEMIFNEILNIRIFANEEIFATSEDSL